MKFESGQIVATKSVLEFVNNEEIQKALMKHLNGDWGNVVLEDAEANEEALLNGARIFSKYMDRRGTPFWIITEADRSSTTVLLPADY